MAVNREQDLYNPIIAGMASEGWVMFRISDGSFGKKPADCAGITPTGVGVLLEVKLVDHIGYNPLPWNRLSMHQRAWLKEYAKNDGIALIVTYYPNDDRLMVYKLQKDGEGYTQFRMVLDKFKRWCGWSQLLND